jgi:hypothetical protein
MRPEVLCSSVGISGGILGFRQLRGRHGSRYVRTWGGYQVIPVDNQLGTHCLAEVYEESGQAPRPEDRRTNGMGMSLDSCAAEARQE